MGSYGSPVIVRRKEVVTAVLPVQEHWLPMTNLDLLLPPLDFGVFFCYKKKNDAGHQPQENNYNMVSVLRKSLAQVLVSFYPLAGELVENNLGEPELLCNNRGVDFVLAYYDVELKGLDLHHPDDSVHGKLVPFRNEGVLSIQVTELKCGGLVIGCTFDHRVADAHTANMFLVAWAEIAQAKPISHVPYFRRSILNPRHPTQCDASFDDMYATISSLPPPPLITPEDDHLLSRIYYIPAEEIIRFQSSAMENGNKRSKLQSFTAYLWKLIAEGDNHDLFSTCRMGIVVDGRERLMTNGGTDVKGRSNLSMQNYFGNVLSIPFGEARCEELKAMPLSEVADMVHGFLAGGTTEEHFRGLIDWVELHRPEPAVAKIYCQLKEYGEDEAMVVSSGQRFPVDKMDFGWGGAVFGSYHFPWGGQTGYVMPMPSASKEGDWIVYMHLSKKHLDLVETKGAHVLRPLTPNYLNF